MTVFFPSRVTKKCFNTRKVRITHRNDLETGLANVDAILRLLEHLSGRLVREDREGHKGQCPS